MTPEGARYNEVKSVFCLVSSVYPVKNYREVETYVKKDIISYRILRTAKRRRYGNLAKKLSAELFMQKVYYGLGRVDRRTASDGNDYIRAGIFESIYACANSGNGGVFFDVVEGGRISILVT